MRLTLILLGVILLAGALHGFLQTFARDEWPTIKKGDER